MLKRIREDKYKDDINVFIHFNNQLYRVSVKWHVNGFDSVIKKFSDQTGWLFVSDIKPKTKYTATEQDVHSAQRKKELPLIVNDTIELLQELFTF